MYSKAPIQVHTTVIKQNVHPYHFSVGEVSDTVSGSVAAQRCRGVARSARISRSSGTLAHRISGFIAASFGHTPRQSPTRPAPCLLAHSWYYQDTALPDISTQLRSQVRWVKALQGDPDVMACAGTMTTHHGCITPRESCSCLCMVMLQVAPSCTCHWVFLRAVQPTFLLGIWQLLSSYALMSLPSPFAVYSCCDCQFQVAAYMRTCGCSWRRLLFL